MKKEKYRSFSIKTENGEEVTIAFKKSKTQTDVNNYIQSLRTELKFTPLRINK